MSWEKCRNHSENFKNRPSNRPYRGRRFFPYMRNNPYHFRQQGNSNAAEGLKSFPSSSFNHNGGNMKYYPSQPPGSRSGAFPRFRDRRPNHNFHRSPYAPQHSNHHSPSTSPHFSANAYSSCSIKKGRRTHNQMYSADLSNSSQNGSSQVKCNSNGEIANSVITPNDRDNGDVPIENGCDVYNGNSASREGFGFSDFNPYPNKPYSYEDDDLPINNYKTYIDVESLLINSETLTPNCGDKPKCDKLNKELSNVSAIPLDESSSVSSIKENIINKWDSCPNLPIPASDTDSLEHLKKLDTIHKSFDSGTNSKFDPTNSDCLKNLSRITHNNSQTTSRSLKTVDLLQPNAKQKNEDSMLEPSTSTYASCKTQEKKKNLTSEISPDKRISRVRLPNSSSGIVTRSLQKHSNPVVKLRSHIKRKLSDKVSKNSLLPSKKSRNSFKEFKTDSFYGNSRLGSSLKTPKGSTEEKKERQLERDKTTNQESKNKISVKAKPNGLVVNTEISNVSSKASTNSGINDKRNKDQKKTVVINGVVSRMKSNKMSSTNTSGKMIKSQVSKISKMKYFKKPVKTLLKNKILPIKNKSSSATKSIKVQTSKQALKNTANKFSKVKLNPMKEMAKKSKGGSSLNSSKSLKAPNGKVLSSKTSKTVLKKGNSSKQLVPSDVSKTVSKMIAKKKDSEKLTSKTLDKTNTAKKLNSCLNMQKINSKSSVDLNKQKTVLKKSDSKNSNAKTVSKNSDAKTVSKNSDAKTASKNSDAKTASKNSDAKTASKKSETKNVLKNSSTKSLEITSNSKNMVKTNKTLQVVEPEVSIAKKSIIPTSTMTIKHTATSNVSDFAVKKKKKRKFFKGTTYQLTVSGVIKRKRKVDSSSLSPNSPRSTTSAESNRSSEAKADSIESSDNLNCISAMEEAETASVLASESDQSDDGQTQQVARKSFCKVSDGGSNKCDRNISLPNGEVMLAYTKDGNKANNEIKSQSSSGLMNFNGTLFNGGYTMLASKSLTKCPSFAAKGTSSKTKADPMSIDQPASKKICRKPSDMTIQKEAMWNLRPSENFFKNELRSGELQQVVNVLANGANPNYRFRNDDHNTPLHFAAELGFLPIVKLLIQSGAHIDSVNDNLRTPLMMAIENSHVSVVQYLLVSGAEAGNKDGGGMTSFHIAAFAGSLEIMKLVYETGMMDIDCQDDGGWTALVWACEYSHHDVADWLLNCGTDPDIRDKEMNVALHWAAFSGDIKCLASIIDKGSNVNAINKRKDSPLHIASRKDHFECVSLLVSRGALINIRNQDNLIPLFCCRDFNSETFKFLQSYDIETVTKMSNRFDTCSDVTRGQELHPIQVVNNVDNEQFVFDFCYTTNLCESPNIHINKLVKSINACRCCGVCTKTRCTCSALSVRLWYDKKRRLIPDFNMANPPVIFECSKMCRCSQRCLNRVVQNGIRCHFQLFRTRGKGWGVKPLHDIDRGVFVCEYLGELLSDAEAEKREDDSYLLDLESDAHSANCIDAKFYGNISRFINHSCEPNLTAVKVFIDHQDLNFPRIALFSNKPIKAYEELSFDYGERFWQIKSNYFLCMCGTPSCKYSTDTINTSFTKHRSKLKTKSAKSKKV